jgi:hypothetical protein
MDQKIGLKITSAEREYYRYTGVSAEAERRGVGKNSPDFSRVRSRAQPDVQDRSSLPPTSLERP